MAEVHGTCDPKFESVRAALSASLDAGSDVGASIAVLLHGEPVVDIWGGWADETRTRPWEGDTLTNVWSTTKTMTFLCALMLADQGELDFGAPVATYWPEFAQAGKARVEVRHLMSHSAGLSGWEVALAPEELADWERCTSLLAAQEPWWEPGTASGYHAVTQGYLIGEVVRRITGESIGTWFAKEIAAPLGADFFIGLPESEDGRTVNVIPNPPLDPDSLGGRSNVIQRKTFTNPPLDAANACTTWWKRAEIPAANGQGNARSVALIQSIVAGRGEARGVRLLSSASVDKVFESQVNGTDLCLSVPMHFGLGYGLAGEFMPIGPRACFWGGYGGSIILMDQDAGLTFCYVMNKMAPALVGDTRGAGYLMAAVAALAP